MIMFPTKSCCFSALAAVAVLIQAHAAPIAYEGFDYTAAQATTGLNGGTGSWSGTWAGASSTTITSPGLTYSGLTTTGNSAFDSNTGSQANARFYTGLNSTNGAELWFSVLANPAGTGSDQRIYGLSDNGIFSGDGGAGFFLSGGLVQNRFNSASVSTGVSFTAGTTMLLVARYTFSDTAGQDALTIWVNPSLTGGTPTGGTTQLGDFGSTWLSSPQVGFRGGNGWTGTVDEIHLGTTFADVVPEPGTAVLAVAGVYGLLLKRRRRA